MYKLNWNIHAVSVSCSLNAVRMQQLWKQAAYACTFRYSVFLWVPQVSFPNPEVKAKEAEIDSSGKNGAWD